MIVDKSVFENGLEGLSYLVGKVKHKPAKAVLESTSNLWLRIYEALESNGVEVKLANPFKTKAIASARWHGYAISSVQPCLYKRCAHIFAALRTLSRTTLAPFSRSHQSVLSSSQ